MCEVNIDAGYILGIAMYISTVLGFIAGTKARKLPDIFCCIFWLPLAVYCIFEDIGNDD